MGGAAAGTTLAGALGAAHVGPALPHAVLFPAGASNAIRTKNRLANDMTRWCGFMAL